MIDRKKLFDFCNSNYCTDPIYKSFQENYLLSDQVNLLIAQDKNILTADELDLVRTFFMSALSSVNKDHVIADVMSTNSDYSIYFSLKLAFQENDLAILRRSLKGVSDSSAYAVFGYLYPNKYSLQSYSVVRPARIIFRDVKTYCDALDVEFSSIQQKIVVEMSLTNNLLCQEFKKYGFKNPLELSVMIGILYKNVYHYKLAEKDAAGLDKDQKIEMKFNKLYSEIIENQEAAEEDSVGLPALPFEEI